MKAKLVNENLNEFANDSGREMTPEIFDSIVDELIADGDRVQAVKIIKNIFDENPWMHEEIGESPSASLLAEPWNKFEAWLDEDPSWEMEVN